MMFPLADEGALVGGDDVLPSTAAQAISTVSTPAGMLTTRDAVLSLAGYAVLLPAVAVIVLRRRDI